MDSSVSLTHLTAGTAWQIKFVKKTLALTEKYARRMTTGVTPACVLPALSDTTQIVSSFVTFPTHVKIL